jgi:serine/threonine-protein kinase
VTDFGIAAALGADEGPEVAGTPEYMSPEQALGGELDARSDLYGLGATAFFLCAGRPPFSGARAVDVLAKQVATAAPALSSVGASVPRKLAHLIEKCLAKEPRYRPASAQHLAEQLTLAVEQRREVPAALRAFVKRDGRLTGGGSLIVGYFALVGAVPIVIGLGPILGPGVIVATLLGIPFAGMTWAARGLIKRGFSLADVGSAFESEIEQLREEFMSAGRVERRGIEQAAGIVAAGAGFGLAALMWVGLDFTGDLVGGASLARSLIPFAAIATIGGLVIRQVLRSRRPHSAPESWAKLWLGRAGRAAFAFARKLGARPAAGASTTHRATEMAIGMAAGELFSSLPKVTQKALGDVPGIVNNLQKDAASLRTRLDQLNESLADAGDAATGPEYAELREVRDELARRHRDVITTLETTRLNLLRLHAGAATVDGLTTHFDLADEVSHEVRRLLEARGEVERYLKFPSPPRRTPG